MFSDKILKLFTSNNTSPFSTICLFVLRFTFLPTINSANFLLVVFFGSSSPTIFPLLKTFIRSHTSNTSCNLCVIKIIAFPAFFKFLIISKNSTTSCGVRTAVGSSKIKISASRNNIFIISTLCCIPTGNFSISWSGSTSKLYSELIFNTFSLALVRSILLNVVVGSVPKMIFSVTEKTGTNIKC